MTENETVLSEAVKNQGWVLALSSNGMRYVGQVLVYDPEERILTVLHDNEKSGTDIKTDIYLDSLCSLQHTTHEEVQRMRENKKQSHGKRTPYNARKG